MDWIAWNDGWTRLLGYTGLLINGMDIIAGIDRNAGIVGMDRIKKCQDY